MNITRGNEPRIPGLNPGTLSNKLCWTVLYWGIGLWSAPKELIKWEKHTHYTIAYFDLGYAVLYLVSESPVSPQTLAQLVPWNAAWLG